jgi:hypothetical protein
MDGENKVKDGFCSQRWLLAKPKLPLMSAGPLKHFPSTASKEKDSTRARHFVTQEMSGCVWHPHNIMILFPTPLLAFL